MTEEAVRNALLLIDGDYLLSGINPTREEDMAAFKRYVNSMVASKEQAFRCRFNVFQRVVYFTDDLVGQLGVYHSSLATAPVEERSRLADERVQSASRQAILTSLKKERYTVVVLNQPGGPITGGAGRLPGGPSVGASHPQYASPVDAAISTRVMATVARQAALLSCDYAKWAPSALSDVVLFAQRGYYEPVFEALNGEGPLAALSSFDAPAEGGFKVSIHMSCFEGDAVDDTLLPYLSDEVQLQIPRGSNGGLYTLSTKQIGSTHAQPQIGATSGASTVEGVPEPAPIRLSTADMMCNLFDDDVSVAVEVMRVPDANQTAVVLPPGTREVRVEQNGVACPGVATVLPLGTDMFFDQLYRRHYFVSKRGEPHQVSSWEHPLGGDHQEHVEEQVLAWWRAVQAGTIKHNSGASFDPNADASFTPRHQQKAPNVAVVAAPAVQGDADSRPKSSVLSSATVRPQPFRANTQPTPLSPQPNAQPQSTSQPQAAQPPTTPTQPEPASLPSPQNQTGGGIPKVERVRASLPSGWDCREIRRQNGSVRIVFIDHANKTTSWEGPAGWTDPTL